MREFLRYRELLFSLVLTDLKIKYRGSGLGFLWSLLNPLAMIIVYSVAFRYVLRIQLEHFTVFLVAGLLPWLFFANSSLGSTVALISNANLLKKVYFPREILPGATVLSSLVQMLLAFAVFVPSLLVLRGGISWTLVYYPVVLALQVAFVYGVALGLSALTVSFRDLRHLAEVTLMMLFWMTPIVYDASMVPSRLRAVMVLNPMTPFVSSSQDLVYWGRVPEAASFLWMVGWAVAVLLAGWAIFRRREGNLVEDL